MSNENEDVRDVENGSAEPQKTIDPADHKRAIDDMLKYKGQVRDLTSRMEGLVGEIEGLKSKQLEEKEDYKALYEQERSLHEETKAKLLGVSKNVMFAEKHRAVFPALKKAGFRDEAEKMLTPELLNDLELETTSDGRFLVEGVETFVDMMKRDYPFYFRESKPPRINSGVGEVSFSSEKITPAMINDLEDQVKSGKLPREKYEEAVQKYLDQKRRS